MSKKIVFIHGSPRKNGNTRALAGEAMAALTEAGAICAEIDATRISFKHPGCLGCLKCQNSPDFGCHVGDELASSVASLPEYDALVLSTPLYWFQCTAQLKIFIDRMFSLLKFTETGEIISPLKGKPLALLATSGGGMKKNMEMLDAWWRNAAEKMGSPYLPCLFPSCNFPPGEAAKDPALSAKARGFGKELALML